MKRIISMICVFVLALSVNVMPVNTQAAVAKAAYITVEKLTIGQGFIVEPTKVEIKDGDTVKTVFEKVMKANNLSFKLSQYGYYLSSILNVDTHQVDIPKTLSSMEDYNSQWGNFTAPSNDNNTGNADDDLDEKDYSEMSGWMYFVNNKLSNEAADTVLVNNQDVIRFQFSLYGYGADLGASFGDDVITPAKLANKDALIKKIADVKDTKDFTTIAAAKKILSDGMAVLEKYDATDAEVKTALSAIEKYETPTPKVSVGNATIKKIKNIKGKRAKITVKKVSGATGYIFKYSNKKSFKKYTIKDTKKLTIKTKKFKKKQTCYAKVVAYLDVSGSKVFGNWSKVKKVKIKK